MCGDALCLFRCPTPSPCGGVCVVGAPVFPAICRREWGFLSGVAGQALCNRRFWVQFEQKVDLPHYIAQVNSCNKAFNTALPHDRGWEQSVLAAPLGSTAWKPPGALQGATSSSKSWWVHVMNHHVHIWSVCTRQSFQSMLIYSTNRPPNTLAMSLLRAACTPRHIVLYNVCLQQHSSCGWPSRAVPGFETVPSVAALCAQNSTSLAIVHA